MLKKTLAGILALILFCTAAFAALPEPDTADTEMIIGDSGADRVMELTLYYANATRSSLTPVERTVVVRHNEQIESRAIEELMKPSGSGDITFTLPSDSEIRRVERCGNMVVADLTVDVAELETDTDRMLLISSVCETLKSIEGVEYVNVLLNSRVETVGGMPVGAITHAEHSVVVDIAKLQGEYERLHNAIGDTVVKCVFAYAPSCDGKWIYPVVMNLPNETGRWQDMLVEEVNNLVGLNGSDMLPYASSDYVDEHGLRLIDLELPGVMLDYLTLSGCEDWQTIAAYVVTLCTGVPEIDGVKVVVDGTPLDILRVGDREMRSLNGFFRRRDFEGYIGSSMTLCYPGENGLLNSIERIVSAKESCSAYCTMQELLKQPDEDAMLHSPFPEGMLETDILGTYVDGDIAKVNFAENFYRLCQKLDFDQERMLVYSIVNTLCMQPEIRSVEILIEGERVETLANRIYLKSELMPNPGLMAE